MQEENLSGKKPRGKDQREKDRRGKYLAPLLQQRILDSDEKMFPVKKVNINIIPNTFNRLFINLIGDLKITFIIYFAQLVVILEN